MKCLNTQSIYDYLENQMPEEKKTELKIHLQKCSRCRRLLSDRRRFIKASESLPQWQLPANFVFRIMTRIKARESLSTTWLWLSIGAAIPAFFMLMGLILIRYGPMESWNQVIQSLVNIFQQGIVIFMKGLKILALFLRTAAGFIGLLLEKLGDLASLAPPETPFLAAAVLILITAALLLGMPRKSRLGEK